MLWFLLSICVVYAATLTERVEELESQLTATTSLLEKLTRGQVLMFKDVENCPPGFYPAETAEGRLLMVGKNRGAATKHTMFTNDGVREVFTDCDMKAEVAESGLVEVCVHSDQNSIKLNIQELIPTWEVMLCMKINDGSVKTNPKVT